MNIRACIRSEWSLMLLAFHFFGQGGAVAQNELKQIRQTIAEKGAKWIARETDVSRRFLSEQKNFVGGLRLSDLPREKLLAIPRIMNLPSKFDWRANGGNWVTPPKDQRPCASCWDFGVVAQTESWWKIRNMKPDSMIDLSEQFILSCSNGGSCVEGDPAVALETIRTVGIPGERCFPYKADHTIPCNTACADWHDNVVKIPGWGVVTVTEVVIDNIKSAVYRHPISGGMVVYQDFYLYAGGVYEHVRGEWSGLHYVLIVGWNDEDQCWICKNSWGGEWGETDHSVPYTPGTGNGGYFRIKYDQCQIGMYAMSIWDEITDSQALAVSPQRIDTTLRIGDTALVFVTLSNTGLRQLEFTSFPRLHKAGQFHSDNAVAFSGKSWWCGDPTIGGYADNWLQYLDLPVRDLSNTVHPKLSFMAYWATEPPGQSTLFDGWDGCNVWVSTDSGKSFDAAIPMSPPYNCSSVAGFGGIIGWRMRPGIPGWAGKSNVWRPIEFDLSGYRTDNVIIRFAFASDLGYSAVVDPTLKGFAIDDIVVSDGNTVLFENHGDADTAMHADGYAGLEGPDWLSVSPSRGTIPPHASLTCTIRIATTRGLVPGRYCADVTIIPNDTTYLPIESEPGRIHINLDVGLTTDTPDQTVGIPGAWGLQQNYSNPFNSISNFGFGILELSWVTLKVYDLLGREVAVLVNERKAPGSYTVTLNAAGLASGVYFYRLQTARFVKTMKMVLTK